MGIILGIASLLCALFAAITVKPDFVPFLPNPVLTEPFAQLLAMRGVLAVVFVGLGVLLLLISVILRGFLRRFWLTRISAVVLIIAGLIHAGVVCDRGINNPDRLPKDQGISGAQHGDGSLTVLSYNTLGGATNTDQLADVIVNNGVDVVSLPETSTKRGQELLAELQKHGMKFQIFTTETPKWNPEFSSTILLVSESLGKYKKVSLPMQDVPELSIVSAEPASGNGPKIIAAHPIAPTHRNIDLWKREISAVYGLCESQKNYILAGDFNSTVDHQNALGANCADAVAEAGSAGLGTWPASMPALLSAPIDRVLHDGATYRGQKATTVRIGNSDHRGILVRLGQQ
ncbi:endonuclease/exonuclease/phosphatase (EEP) superfamily protein YafD [Arcanobacterium pluranimalium]|uniref:endonuclease/exonuclease/phosphatase family protein n=1 Tax=Arcanobacterium pluranimalium TaxID=108028 RepID=UPI00195D2EAE|nr:endonuclease/exonuclease/phosphatase family protein [Arcanobacterium pluranimalium]MBM7824365.1 endonuclease/exonuclease/phosphatase (EEP) superfamily protein YafD [Arcanobacterium pluranimalium]